MSCPFLVTIPHPQSPLCTAGRVPERLDLAFLKFMDQLQGACLANQGTPANNLRSDDAVLWVTNLQSLPACPLQITSQILDERSQGHNRRHVGVRGRRCLEECARGILGQGNLGAIGELNVHPVSHGDLLLGSHPERVTRTRVQEARSSRSRVATMSHRLILHSRRRQRHALQLSHLLEHSVRLRQQLADLRLRNGCH